MNVFFEWERRNDTTAIVLVNNSTDTAWFRKLVTYADAVWFPPRIKFERVVNGVRGPILDKNGKQVGNRYAQAIVAFGIEPEHFFKSMKPLGGWGARL